MASCCWFDEGTNVLLVLVKTSLCFPAICLERGGKASHSQSWLVRGGPTSGSRDCEGMRSVSVLEDIEVFIYTPLRAYFEGLLPKSWSDWRLKLEALR